MLAATILRPENPRAATGLGCRVRPWPSPPSGQPVTEVGDRAQRRRLLGVTGNLRSDWCQPTLHNTRLSAKALSPSVVSITVQVLSVVFTSMPKNRLTNQKPESLT